jgi:phytoene dehydrogenase-like protein
LREDDIPFLILEADQRIGGRLKTDTIDGFVLNCGFQVLQTAYPEARRVLNYDRLELRPFAPGTIIRINGDFHRIAEPYLILNGDESGWVSSLTIPSTVAPSYAPAGQHLISVVVIGHRSADEATVEATVRQELAEWFGPVVRQWRHLKTYHILYALPGQNPPMPDPTKRSAAVRPGIYVCGEYGSVPGIQWAMLSGRQIAEEVLKMMNSNLSQVSPSVDQ